MSTPTSSMDSGSRQGAQRSDPGSMGKVRQAPLDLVAEGALPARTKELMALSIAVVKQCDGCITYQAKATARRGATRRGRRGARRPLAHGRRHRQRVRAASLGRLPRVRRDRRTKVTPIADLRL